MNPTETPNDDMDFRTFFGKCPTAAKTETKPETKTEEDLEFEEAYRQGFKDGREEENSELLLNGWDFEPTLDDLANGCPPMSKWIGDECFYRYMTKEERESIYFHGQVIKFPVRWGLDGTTYERRGIPQKEWEAGERWTLGRVWRTARQVYSKNKQKAVKEMGDHHFWEGIDEKTGEIYTGS